MGSKRNVSMSTTTDTVKVVADEMVEADLDSAAQPSSATAKTKKSAHAKRGKRYVAARSIIDKTKLYTVAEAVEMVKRSSYAKFDASITVDGVVREIGEQGSLTFPHSTGKSFAVAIVTDELIEQIEAGNIDFDVLLTTPAFMPKLAKFARVLGPKGLMPNPKNGTITQDPAAKKKELEKGKVTIKTEKKAPLIHVIVGKKSFESDQLVANIEALIATLDARLKKLTISAAMGPGIKVKLS